MNDPFAGGQPLRVAAAEAGGGAQRVGVIYVTTANEGDGFKTAMRVLRKARHHGAVIHAPSILTAEVLTDVPAAE